MSFKDAKKKLILITSPGGKYPRRPDRLNALLHQQRIHIWYYSELNAVQRDNYVYRDIEQLNPTIKTGINWRTF